MSSSMSMLDKKRIAYVSETAMQRHNEHLMGAMTTGSYQQNSNYLLVASGAGSPLSASMSGMSMSSGNTSVQAKLNLSVYDSTPSETKMDIMGGTVTAGTNDVRSVQSGFAYYLPGYNKFIAVGFIPVKGSDGSIQSVQLVRLWAALNGNQAKLPSSSSDSPLAIQVVIAKSYLGSDWILQMTGTVAYSGGSGMSMGSSGGSTTPGTTSSMPQCGPVTVPITGGSQNASYYVSASYNGKCAIDMTSYSMQSPCTVVNGIGSYGHCEPITKGYSVSGNTGASVMARDEWFHMKSGTSLTGTTLKPGEFLDIVDTTPFFSTMGHIATVIPCDQYGDPKVLIYAGILDGGLNTIQPIQPQYLQQLSNPANGLCVYHFNFGATANNPDGVTDFALLNVSKDTVTFTDRNTLTFSLAEGYLNNAGGP